VAAPAVSAKAAAREPGCGWSVADRAVPRAPEAPAAAAPRRRRVPAVR